MYVHVCLYIYIYILYICKYRERRRKFYTLNISTKSHQKVVHMSSHHGSSWLREAPSESFPRNLEALGKAPDSRDALSCKTSSNICPENSALPFKGCGNVWCHEALLAENVWKWPVNQEIKEYVVLNPGWMWGYCVLDKSNTPHQWHAQICSAAMNVWWRGTWLPRQMHGGITYLSLGKSENMQKPPFFQLQTRKSPLEATVSNSVTTTAWEVPRKSRPICRITLFQGLGLVSLLGDLFHITFKYISWKLYHQ